MQTKLREVVERGATLIAFMPNPPQEKFTGVGQKGHLGVTALSFLDENTWIRGWRFGLFDGGGQLVEERFLDQSEATEIRRLLSKWSDESVSLAYQYQSKEGITFRKFSSNQRVSIRSPGLPERNGIEAPQMVENVFAFMESAAKVWE
jgi:hypothetical protein